MSFMMRLVSSGYIMSLNNRDSREVGGYVVVILVTGNVVEKREVSLHTYKG